MKNENQYEGIEVNYKELIVFLLIVIIFILLYYNGFFYKFKLVTNNNLLEIQSSSKLSLEEKMKIANKIAKEDINKYIDKPIWYMLNN